MFQKEKERQNRLSLLRHEHHEFDQQKFIEVHAPLAAGSCINIEHKTASELFTTIPVSPCLHQAARSHYFPQTTRSRESAACTESPTSTSLRSASLLPKVSQSSNLAMDKDKQAANLPNFSKNSALAMNLREGGGSIRSLFHTIDRKYSVQEVEMLITKALAEDRKRGRGGGERNGRWKLDTCTWHPPPDLEPLYIYRAQTRRLGTHGHSKFLSTC